MQRVGGGQVTKNEHRVEKRCPGTQSHLLWQGEVTARRAGGLQTWILAPTAVQHSVETDTAEAAGHTGSAWPNRKRHTGSAVAPLPHPPTLAGEFVESAPSLGEPVDFLLEELPLGGGLTLLLQQPRVVLPPLQYLHHGLLQQVAILSEHEILDDERDLVGQTVAGFLEEGVRRGAGGVSPEACGCREQPWGFWRHARSPGYVLVVPPTSLECPVSKHGEILSGLPDFNAQVLTRSDTRAHLDGQETQSAFWASQPSLELHPWTPTPPAHRDLLAP